VFVATDRDPMISDIEEHFRKKKVCFLSFMGTFFAAVLYL